MMIGSSCRALCPPSCIQPSFVAHVCLVSVNMADSGGGRPQKRHAGPRSWQPTNESQRNAGAELLEELLRLYSNCRLTAQMFCRLCYLADQAGCSGADFSSYAFTGRDCQRHLDTLLPQGGELIIQTVPMNHKKGHARSAGTVPMRCLWSSIEQELRDDPSILDILDGRCEQNVTSTPMYKSNPTVRASEQRPLPVNVYLDAVQYIQQSAGRCESVNGLWVENAISQRRHFVCAVRSGDLCACGCRAWCTIQPLLARLEWMLYSMQQGVVPSVHPDGSAYTPCAGGMQCGTRLSRKVVLQYVKGDWAEHVHSLGLISWHSKLAGCPFCAMSKDEIDAHNHELCTLCPKWPLRVAADYESSCRKCEVRSFGYEG